jgi:hypothetical protein
VEQVHTSHKNFFTLTVHHFLETWTCRLLCTFFHLFLDPERLPLLKPLCYWTTPPLDFAEDIFFVMQTSQETFAWATNSAKSSRKTISLQGQTKHAESLHGCFAQNTYAKRDCVSVQRSILKTFRARNENQMDAWSIFASSFARRALPWFLLACMLICTGSLHNTCDFTMMRIRGSAYDCADSRVVFQQVALGKTSGRSYKFTLL